MSVLKVEAELAAVEARIARLSAELSKAQEWKAELTTSLRVFERLSGRHEAGAVPAPPSEAKMKASFQPRPSESHADAPVHSHRRQRARSEAVQCAEQALIGMLERSGAYIRQIDAVQRLRDEHGVIVGNGIPGRETSDLSAALGNGKSPRLVVTRRYGWALKEWNGKPPAMEGVTSEDNGVNITEDVGSADSEPAIAN